MLSPVVDEPPHIPTEMGISNFELAIRSSESLSTSSSESWLSVHNDLDDNIRLAGETIQSSQRSNPDMSSPMFLDTPRETPAPDSAGSSSEDTQPNPDKSTANIRNSSAARDHEQTAEVVRQNNAKKRKAPNSGPYSKRTNSQQENSLRGGVECLQVEKYIEMEKEKCAKLGIPYDEHNYLSPAVAEWITALNKDDERAAVSMISTAIGSSESIALLQHILVKSRAKDRQTKPAEDLALADRVREIQRLGSQIAFIQFLRRCHIWKLYTDISREVGSPQSGFVVLTSESISNPKGGRAGNPNYARDSEITKAMICGSASELDLDSPEYQKRYRSYSKIRKLGQRLELLTKTFGFGVLGLILSQDPLETIDVGVRISDETWVQLSFQRPMTNSPVAFCYRLRKHSKTVSICLIRLRGI
jgi:hypothetical protein